MNIYIETELEILKKKYYNQIKKNGIMQEELKLIKYENQLYKQEIEIIKHFIICGFYLYFIYLILFL